jgi:hypothetical protein
VFSLYFLPFATYALFLSIRVFECLLVSYSFLLFSVDVVLNFPTSMLKEALLLAVRNVQVMVLKVYWCHVLKKLPATEKKQEKDGYNNLTTFCTVFRGVRKISKSDCWPRYVCPSLCWSVRMELGFHWTDFHEILYLNIFRKSVKKFNFE